MNLPLPSRDGVGPSAVWLPDGPWPTVLEFLVHRFAEIDAATWIERMINGDVVDEHGIALAPDHAYRGGVRVYYYREQHAETPIPFEETVLYRDDHLVAVDKPHFLPVVPAGRFLKETLLVRLKQKLGLEFLTPIHRIDRETAGVVLFSIQPQTRGAYQALFQQRQVRKVYHALAPRCATLAFPFTHRSRLEEGNPFFVMKQVPGEPNTETRIDVLEIRGELALYQLAPVTGKKHQLRVHMAALGIPIVNDSFYPNVAPEKNDDFSDPLQLVAKTIAFVDPLTRTARQFESRYTLPE